MSLAKPRKQNGSKKANNNKDLRVLVVISKKIILITISIIPTSRKLSIALTKVTLPEGKQDLKVKKV